MKKRIIIFSCLLFAPIYFLRSQTDNYFFYHDYEAWEGGIYMGVNSFYGDINDNTNKIFPATPFQKSFYQDRHFVVGGYFGKRMTPFWTLSLDFNFGRVSGKMKYDNLAFRTSWNTQVTLSNTLDILSMCNLNTAWAVYPKIGFGVYAFRSQVWNTSTGGMINTFPHGEFDPETNTTMARGYRCAFAMPIALGGSFRPLPELRVFLETGITWVCTDMLDAYQSTQRGFEGVWNTVVGVSYQFNFTPYRGANPRSATSNDALEDDGISKKYKKMRWKSNLGTGKPRYSTSSSIKKHKRR